MTDNKQMWTELGMDVETHDLLCEALPQAYGDVYLSQENRPEGMDYFNMIVADIHGLRPAELIEAQKEGKKVVGSFCIHVPDELVLAAGAIPTGLCSGSQFWVPEGEKHLPTTTCPLIKASIGARFGRTCPYSRIADLFVCENTCDGKKKAWEILAEDAPVYVMDIPQMKRERDFLHWKDELYGYKEKLEEITGNKITEESLKEAIHTVNEKRKALQRLYNFRKEPNVPISGLDTLLITQIAFFDDPKRFAAMVNKLCDELDQKKAEGFSVYEKDAVRLMLSGTPLSIPNWKLHHIIESSGAAVIIEEMCTGSRYFENLVDESGETIDEMLENLTQRYLGGINCACFTPNDARIDDIIRLSEEYHADGVIDVNLKFCGIYDMEGVKVEKTLKEKDIPILGIETDYTDQDAEQLKTRIGAFVELLENR